MNHKPGRIDPNDVKFETDVDEIVNDPFKPAREMFDKLLRERIEQREKELCRALKILEEYHITAIETLDGRRLPISYLLSFKHEWDVEEDKKNETNDL